MSIGGSARRTRESNAERQRMRIAYVITRADEIGGAQVHVRDLAIALHQRDHDVTVLAGSPGPMSDQLSASGVTFECVPALRRSISPWRDVIAVQQLMANLRRLRPDLVSTHSSKAGWLGRLAARLLEIPVTFTAHGWAFSEGVPAIPRHFYALAERLAAPLADHIIAVSEYDRKLALARGIVAERKITRIYNGVADLAKEPGPQRSGPPRILMTGRFAPQKDHAGLVRALGHLRHLDWVLDFAGAGATQTDVAALVESIELDDRVNFLGQRHDVPDLLRRADIYALISHWEGFPYGVIEAMSAGLPVLASDVGGVAEAVGHGMTGFVVPRGDENAVAERIAVLLRDPDLRARLGASGRRRYQEEFRIDVMLERTLGLYEEVVAARRGQIAPARSA
jgi:glycosyltransferase involved in cell wall biosynthesis